MDVGGFTSDFLDFLDHILRGKPWAPSCAVCVELFAKYGPQFEPQAEPAVAQELGANDADAVEGDFQAAGSGQAPPALAAPSAPQIVYTPDNEPDWKNITKVEYTCQEFITTFWWHRLKLLPAGSRRGYVVPFECGCCLDKGGKPKVREADCVHRAKKLAQHVGGDDHGKRMRKLLADPNSKQPVVAAQPASKVRRVRCEGFDSETDPDKLYFFSRHAPSLQTWLYYGGRLYEQRFFKMTFGESTVQVRALDKEWFRVSSPFPAPSGPFGARPSPRPRAPGPGPGPRARAPGPGPRAPAAGPRAPGPRLGARSPEAQRTRSMRTGRSRKRLKMR